LAQGNTPVVTRRQAALAVEFPVGNPDRQHWPARGQRRLDQGGVKMQQMRAIGRRAFGKYGHIFPLSQNFSDLLVDDPGMPAAAPAQEDRVVFRRQPADQRPVPHLFLGNEGRRQYRIDDIDVDPRNMVGNHQRARHGMGQVGFDRDAQRIEQRDGPTGFQPAAHGLAANRKNAKDDQSPAGDQQGQAKQPEGASQGVGFVQSVCPR